MASLRTVLPALLLLAAGLGCSRDEAPADPQGPPSSCYREMTLDAPGFPRLSGPVECTAGGRLVRVEGPPERPLAIHEADARGQLSLSLRIERDARGRPRREERVMMAPAQPMRVYDRGQRYEFSTPGTEPRLPVTVLTDLDDAGRPVRTEKRVGARVEFVVTRTFGPEGLVREVTAEASGKVRLERRFSVENGRRIERMLDGEGRVLLEREASSAGETGALDKPADPPVQDGPLRLK